MISGTSTQDIKDFFSRIPKYIPTENVICTDDYKSGVYNLKETLFIKKYDNLENDFEIVTNEIEIMQALKNANASNVIQFYGLLDDNINECSIVVSYPQEGSLYNWLSGGSKYPEFREAQQLQIMRGIACGLRDMHKAKILYCNINSKSIMLDKSLNPILSDFRHSVDINDNSPKFKFKSDDLPYLAPELLLALTDKIYKGQYTEKTDIYGFAIVCWEILTNDNDPHPDIYDEKEMNDCVNFENHRPKIPDNCRHSLRILIDMCWSHDPIFRPSAGSIVQRLLKIKSPLKDTDDTIKLNKAINILRKYCDFFAAPYENYDEFHKWARSNIIILQPLSDKLKVFLASKEKSDAFYTALVGKNEKDVNCLRYGKDDSIKYFLLRDEFLSHDKSYSFIQCLIDHEDDPIFVEYFRDQNIKEELQKNNNGNGNGNGNFSMTQNRF